MTKANKASKRLPLRTGGFLWGPRRVRLGLSLRDLEEASGIYRGYLSRMENGVMIPNAAEFEAVMSVIEARGSPQPAS